MSNDTILCAVRWWCVYFVREKCLKTSETDKASKIPLDNDMGFSLSGAVRLTSVHSFMKLDGDIYGTEHSNGIRGAHAVCLVCATPHERKLYLVALWWAFS